MKKWIPALIALSIVMLVSIPFIFIPSSLTVTSTVQTNRSLAGSFRYMSNPENWINWSSRDSIVKKSPCSSFKDCLFLYNGSSYAVTNLYYNALGVRIIQNGQPYESRIDLFAINPDTTFIRWSYSIPSGNNPFTRIQRYRAAVAQKQRTDSLLFALGKTIAIQENVYGQKANLIMAHDSSLIVVNLKTPRFPTTSEIFNAIQQLRSYAKVNNAREINYPMLMPNINTPGAFETFVALSIDKNLPDNGTILHRRYVPWKDLMVEVRGGDSTISHARTALNNYILDNQLQVVSKTYESLVTDRSVEKDSSKWITRLICSIP
jgi:hypothetical protein